MDDGNNAAVKQVTLITDCKGKNLPAPETLGGDVEQEIKDRYAEHFQCANGHCAGDANCWRKTGMLPRIILLCYGG